MASSTAGPAASHERKRGLPSVRPRDLGLRLAASLVLGVVFHAAWVASFILAASLGASVAVKAVLWLFAPILTAAGFTTGLALLPQVVWRPSGSLTRAYLTVLTACAVGAAVMSPIGPMLVGFGVVAGGTAAVVFWCVIKGARTAGGAG